VSVLALDEIEAWSAEQVDWRRDCLRRLAISNDLSAADLDELLALVKVDAGLDVATSPPPPSPFTKSHFGGVKGAPIKLKRLSNVQNVNRLMTGSSIEFCPDGLTIVYGRNGSGKSGYVRILRTACRTRIDKPDTLKVLADVYGASAGPQAADIIIETEKGEETIKWQPGVAADPLLSQVAVFDTQSAQLYVDGGNRIRYLPFGLALPHRLNGVCLHLKERLEAERDAVVGNKPDLTDVPFPIVRDTDAQRFNKELKAETADAAIEDAAKFTAAELQRLEDITAALAADVAAAADLSSLLSWVQAVGLECTASLACFSDDALSGYADLRANAVAARKAADVHAGALSTDDPLPGISSGTWRALWNAARDYSVSEAYPGQSFPVVSLEGGGDAPCVLCQQPLQADAAARMQRFRAYMDDTLGAAAKAAELAVADAEAGLVRLEKLEASDFSQRLEQVRHRDAGLADALAAFAGLAAVRRKEAVARLREEAQVEVQPLASPAHGLTALAGKLQAAGTVLAQAAGHEERQKLIAEKAKLEDQRILAANRNKLVTRRDLLKKAAAYKKALDATGTRGITTKANQLLDTHLTAAVTARFEAERQRFDITHLKVALARKSGQTKAEYEMNPQTKLAKVTSEILSEGEQRALALAGFLTEVALTDGSGPIIVDDPVSSLDRDRSQRVAGRLAEEALARQVVVFTHDLVFFNELYKAADEVGIEPVTVALFSDGEAAGKVDGAGMVWKGLTVAKRIGQLQNDSAGLQKLYRISPSEYEVKIKNLYGRLRDTYERMVEEIIFRDIVRRGVDVIQTQLLRYVTLPDGLAIRFYEGMSRANTHSHDNPSSDTVPVPRPDDFKADVAKLEKLVEDFKTASVEAEAARPQMKQKK
jgi:ABC-type transport system involved in cytochrome c biogenesis ATPase subunit